MSPGWKSPSIKVDAVGIFKRGVYIVYILYVYKSRLYYIYTGGGYVNYNITIQPVWLCSLKSTVELYLSGSADIYSREQHEKHSCIFPGLFRQILQFILFDELLKQDET